VSVTMLPTSNGSAAGGATLEQAGGMGSPLFLQSSDEDRRGVELVLTGAGLAAVAEMAPTHVCSVRANLVDPLSREDFLAVGRAMGTVGRGIESKEAVDGVLTAEEQPA